MTYFSHIHTLTDLKAEHRRLSLILHPDKGGDRYEFGEMQSQYEWALKWVVDIPPMREVFSRDKRYLYHAQPIRYTHCDNWYHYFERESGCVVRVDEQHLELIKEKRLWI